jgi:hypothetical protein
MFSKLQPSMSALSMKKTVFSLLQILIFYRLLQIKLNSGMRKVGNSSGNFLGSCRVHVAGYGGHCEKAPRQASLRELNSFVQKYPVNVFVPILKGHGNEADFLGFLQKLVLIDPLQYLSSHSGFGFTFGEIFVIEKRLHDSASRQLSESERWL